MEEGDKLGDKKKRAPNFSVNEKTLLLNLIYNYKNIIENKKTNAHTWREKDEAWQKVQEMFNSQNTGNYPRTKEALKKYYENIKKNVRKEVANEKKEIFKTGGGPDGGYMIRCIPNPVKEITLGLMNPKTVIGLENNFDSDASQKQRSKSPENQAEHDVTLTDNLDFSYDIYEVNETDLEMDQDLSQDVMETNANIANNNVQEYCEPQPSTSKSVVDLTSTNQVFDNVTNLTGKKRSMLVESKSKKLTKEVRIGQKQSESLKSPWIKRRRPPIQQLPSSKLSEEYLYLSKIKQECFEAEKENVKAREKREQDIFELQKKKT